MATNREGSTSHHVGAFFSMLLGGLLMALLVVSFSKTVDRKEDVLKKQTRIVKMKETKKKVTKKEAPKAAPKKVTRKTPKAQPPDLTSIIGGIAMNIPELAVADIGGDASELLDDIAEDTIMTEDTVDSKPQVTYRAPIEYPEEAINNGIQGYVVVHLLITKNGGIQIAKVLDSEPQGVFDQTVLNAIHDWRFSPARYKGEPVQVWVKQKISFNT